MKLRIITIIALFTTLLLLASKEVAAQYPCGAACSGQGGVCARTSSGGGYSCGNAETCGGVLATYSGGSCPTGCTCEMREWLYNSTYNCSNNCIFVTSCGGGPPPPPPPAGDTCNQTTPQARNECGPIGQCGPCQRRTAINISTPTGAFNCSDVCVNDSSCCGGPPPPPPPPGGPPPPPPPPGGPQPSPSPSTTPQCQNIKAYTISGAENVASSWVPRTAAELSTLTLGTQVRFAVLGNLNNAPGSFDRARFRVNGGAFNEVVLRNPMNEYYYTYTLASVTNNTYVVEAELHHTATNRWW